MFIVVSKMFYTIWDEFWPWHFMSSAAFTCVHGSTTQLVLRELLLRIKLWVFDITFSKNNLTIVLSMFIHTMYISLQRNRETTASNLFHAPLLCKVVGKFHFSLWAKLWFTGKACYKLKIRKFSKGYLYLQLTA